jgi:hypothetical protein
MVARSEEGRLGQRMQTAYHESGSQLTPLLLVKAGTEGAHAVTAATTAAVTTTAAAVAATTVAATAAVAVAIAAAVYC